MELFSSFCSSAFEVREDDPLYALDSTPISTPISTSCSINARRLNNISRRERVRKGLMSKKIDSKIVERLILVEDEQHTRWQKSGERGTEKGSERNHMMLCSWMSITS